MSDSKLKVNFTQIRTRDFAFAFIFLLIQFALVSYFLRNQPVQKITRNDVSAENTIAGVDVDRVDTQISIDLFSCGADKDCATTGDNHQDWIREGDRFEVGIEYSNGGLAVAQGVESILDLPGDVCYSVGSFESSLPLNTSVQYSSTGESAYNWTYSPQANSNGLDCNVRAVKFIESADLDPSSQYEYEVSMFGGTLSGLTEVNDNLAITFPGLFTLGTPLSAGGANLGNTVEISSGFLNNDSFPDMVLTKEGQFDRVFLNNGSGLFTYYSAIPDTLSFDYSDVLHDFDGDGDIDRVHGISSYYDFIMLNDGTGNFTYGANHGLGAGILPHGNLSTIHVNKGDMNGDGFIDLLFSMNNSGQRNRYLTGNGTGVFALAPDQGFGAGQLPGQLASSWAMFPGDLDGDLDLDLIVINGNYYNQVLLNDGTGVFTLGADVGLGAGNLPAGNTEARFADLFDYDDDGDLDIFIARGGAAGQPNYLLVNDGTGTFALGPDFGDGAGVIPGGNRPSREFEFHDIDLDGYEDVIIFNNLYNAQLLKGGPGGSLTLWPDFGYGAGTLPGGTQNARRGEVFDVNGDGAVDVVLPSNNAVAIQFLINNVHPYNSTYSYVVTPTALDSWGDLHVLKTEDVGTELTYSVLDSSCTNVLPGFSNVEVTESLNLSSISAGEYPALCIRGHFYSPTGLVTPMLDEWLLTYSNPVAKGVSGEFVARSSGLTQLLFESTVITTSADPIIDNNVDSITLPFVNLSSGIVITQIGAIQNVPPLDTLYYYITSPTLQIRGVTNPGNSVFFEEGLNLYSAVADGNGLFLIEISLPPLDLGENDFTYYSRTPFGSQSDVKALTLNYDPDYGTDPDPDPDPTDGGDTDGTDPDPTDGGGTDGTPEPDPTDGGGTGTVVTPPPVAPPVETPTGIQVSQEVENILTSASNTVVAVTVGTTSASVVSVGVSSLLELPPLLTRGWYGLLVILRIRKKGVPVGQVFDGFTKDPITQAIVRVYDENGKLVRTDVSGLNGVFYTHLPSGSYKIKVAKAGYRFPSDLIKNWSTDLYSKIYKGELFTAKAHEELNMGVPLDPTKSTFIDRLQLFIRDGVLSIARTLTYILFIFGFTLSVIMLLIAPSVLNLIIMLLYIPVMISTLFVIAKFRRPIYGNVIDTKGQSVEGLQLALKEAKFETLLAERITNEDGEYRFVVGPGSYRLVVLDKKYKLVGGKFLLFEVTKKNFVINPDLIVERI